MITWRKAFSHVPKDRTAVVDGKLSIVSVKKADEGTYACSVQNLLGQDSAVAVLTVLSRLKFTVTPPLKLAASEFSNLMLHCAAQGSIQTVWKRAGKNLPQTHVLYPNGTLLLTRLAASDAGSYACIKKTLSVLLRQHLLLKYSKPCLAAVLNQSEAEAHQVIT